MNIETKVTSFKTGEATLKFVSNTKPKWVDDHTNRNNWAGSDADFHYWVLSENENKKTIYIQYGYNAQPYASVRFYAYSLEILEQFKNDDNSIEVTFSITPLFMKSGTTVASSGVGFKVVYNLSFNNTEFYNYVGTTVDDINKTSFAPMTHTINVKPKEESTRSMLHIKTTYPNGEFPVNEIYIGISLVNPNENMYKPLRIRKGNTWIKLNDVPTSFIKIRIGNVWVDRSLEIFENQNKVNLGHNRIRKNGNWIQQAKP